MSVCVNEKKTNAYTSVNICNFMLILNIHFTDPKMGFYVSFSVKIVNFYAAFYHALFFRSHLEKTYMCMICVFCHESTHLQYHNVISSSFFYRYVHVCLFGYLHEYHKYCAIPYACFNPINAFTLSLYTTFHKSCYYFHHACVRVCVCIAYCQILHCLLFQNGFYLMSTFFPLVMASFFIVILICCLSQRWQQHSQNEWHHVIFYTFHAKCLNLSADFILKNDISTI